MRILTLALLALALYGCCGGTTDRYPWCQPKGVQR
jgi:hypothetical protein